MKSSLRVAKAVLCGIASFCLNVASSQAETRTTDDYIAIDFGAETFTSADERWV